MARIAGVDLPRNKRVEIGLTYIYGIGRSLSNEILRQAGIDPDTRVKDLTESQIAALREIIDREYQVEGDLRREVQMNIRRLIDIRCYRGLRWHKVGKPVGVEEGAGSKRMCRVDRHIFTPLSTIRL